ncbi:MAG: UDP-N-acetylmuramoyl-L-alanyl-D-glutamate--2,6-diaminopimelate ligase [Phycisphaerae bacterium]
MVEGLMATRDDKEVARRTLGALLAGIADQTLPAAQRGRAVTGLFDDSRRVRPGGIFVAIRGTEADGRRFIGDALERGASVLIGENLAPTGDALVINVDDARATLARLATRWYGLTGPRSNDFHLLGVTGTNGKTTTAHMTRAILQAAGLRCGMLGTVQYDLCNRSLSADLTTPGPLELAEHLRQCIDAGGHAAVVEVSSHALAQRRTEGLRLSGAVFTNLSQDHLDYHRTFEAYREAKSRLFAQLDEAAVAVVNRDDQHWEAMLRGCKAHIVTYALDHDADITASVMRDTIGGTRYRLHLDRADLVLENTLVGRHNVYNAMAAAGLAGVLKVPTEAIERGLSSVRSIPGRLQRVPCLRGVEVFVDYAHTDDALRNVARVLKPPARRRLIIVFGCGGERDRTKRPLMAQAAAEFGDALIVTSDNPRSEDPRRIIDDMLAGLDENARRRVLVEPDRRTAIQAALAGATEGDIVLIAGKGHEDCQIVGRQRLHFDDVEVAIQAAEGLKTRKGSSAP